jgi:hypothetical protein
MEKFIWKHKRPQIAKATQQKEQCWRYHNTWLQTILQSNSNKNSMVLDQKMHEDQWNRIEDLDMNPYNYTHLIFDKGAKNIQWRKDRHPLQQMLLGKVVSHLQKLKVDPCLSPCTSIN